MSLKPVQISKSALNEIKQILENKGIPDNYCLRIGIKGGGCGAMGFMIGFDKANDSDLQFSLDNVSVAIEKKHVMYLMGVEVDFIEDGQSRGFVFNKPD